MFSHCSSQKEAQHLFELNYVTVEDCLPSLCQLHRASTLPPADQGAMVRAGHGSVS
ncbi:hypothetical protein DPMN_169909 [Dreissena polymorpha]|uniref:FAN-like N-terminal PH domain-containing protein n=1 Tax=Dreissena polymorpha TaxID=45954 RepID=A0A9D4DYA5_DREPO|nr:hypothetical protein DPMN_169909 [Dreissena polymorpha]